jgi:L,D-transpeptidase YnhG
MSGPALDIPRRSVVRPRWFVAAAVLALLCVVYTVSGRSRPPQPDQPVRASVRTQAPETAELTLKAHIDPAGPEARLLRIYSAMAQGHSQEALQLAQDLVREVPSFGLGQLVYADLLRGIHRPVQTLGEIAIDPGSPSQAELLDLRAEAMVRMHALQDESLSGKVPREFVSIPAAVSTAIAVDGEKSRLYLLRNTPAGLQLAESFYVSVGKLGLDKVREGDMKTPVGVYFIMRSIEKSKLRQIYGSGALAINFPNEVDLRQGRSGRSIWLHGVPPSSFSRPPLATDGCIVLSNRDLEKLWNQVVPLRTPVLIARHIDWVDPGSQAGEREELTQRLEAWYKAVADGSDRQAGFYTSDYTARLPASILGLRRQSKINLNEVPRRGAFSVRDVVIMHWNEGQDMAVTSFEEFEQSNSKLLTKRVYWRKEGERWMIFHEDGTPS